MSYTLNYDTSLALRDVLSVLPINTEIRESKGSKDTIYFTLLWHEPEHKKDNLDLYGVEISFVDTAYGPNSGYAVNKKVLQERKYRDSLRLRIDKGHTICINGQGLLNDKLKLKGFDAWID